MKLGILQCGHAPDPVAQKHGDFDHMFTQLLAPYGYSYEVWNVVDMDFPDGPEAADAWLLTGSKHGAYEDHPFIPPLEALIRDIHASGRRMLGICFGHQLLALLLGGKAERAEQGWGVGVHSYRLAGKPEWMSPALDELQLLISHQDQVTRLPEKATLLASSDFCPIGAYHIEDQVLCFQGHPEFVHDYSRALLDLRQQHLGEQVYQQGVDSLKHSQQGSAVAEWMMRFVAQGKESKA